MAVDGAISNTLAAIVSKLCWTVTVPPNSVAWFDATVKVLFKTVLLVTVKVLSNVTASSTFKVPLTVVISPEVAISTVPPFEAKIVWAEEVNVVSVVWPCTSKGPS